MIPKNIDIERHRDQLACEMAMIRKCLHLISKDALLAALERYSENFLEMAELAAGYQDTIIALKRLN